MTLWQVDIYPAAGRPDLAGRRAAAGAADLGLGDHLTIHAAYGYLLQGELTREQVELLARELLSDPIVERTIVGRAGEAALAQVPPEAGASACAVHVLPKPGVMDPVAISTRQAIADFHLQADEVRTFRKYWIEGLSNETELARLADAGQLVLRYVNPGGTEDVPFPHNPNGSQAHVAGICDETGRVLGLMPHPERNIDPTHHPQWTRRRNSVPGDGLKLFQNAVEYFQA